MRTVPPLQRRVPLLQPGTETGCLVLAQPRAGFYWVTLEMILFSLIFLCTQQRAVQLILCILIRRNHQLAAQKQHNGVILSGDSDLFLFLIQAEQGSDDSGEIREQQNRRDERC